MESPLDRAVRDAIARMQHVAHRLDEVPTRPLPTLEQARFVADEARALLFPEVFAPDADATDTLTRFAERVRALVLLERHAACPEVPGVRTTGYECPPCLEWATAAAATLISRLPDLRCLGEGDIEATLDGDPAANSASEVVLCYPGFSAILVHRIAHVLYGCGARLAPRLLSETVHARTGIELHPGASIGPRFFIDHGTGVVVGETAVIGERVRLYQGVTLGARSLPRAEARRLQGVKRHPTLEDEVIVYANATILGGDTVIGAGAIVGGNCWVTTSVPAGARVSLDVAPRAAEAVVSRRDDGSDAPSRTPRGAG